MEDIKYVSYPEWTSLVSAVMLKGLSCEEINTLRKVYPQVSGSAYDSMIYNQLAKLEEYIIKESVRILQKQMNVCLEENDLQILESSFSKFRKHILNCMFFLQVPYYPDSVKNKLSNEIKKNMDALMDSFSRHLKKVEYADSNSFIQEYVYVCRKKILKIKKCIRGVVYV